MLSRSALLPKLANLRSFWSSAALMKGRDDRQTMIRSMPKQDEGAQGEKATEIDVSGYSRICEFPQVDTPDRLFNNMPFSQIPILHIRATKNNTHFQLTTAEGHPLYQRSCGVDGFKNCRKRSGIAAQTTATSFAKVISKMGYTTCRVALNGLGAGRKASFKGLQLSGINIISITDTTPIYEYPKERPPAARSL